MGQRLRTAGEVPAFVELPITPQLRLDQRARPARLREVELTVPQIQRLPPLAVDVAREPVGVSNCEATSRGGIATASCAGTETLRLAGERQVGPSATRHVRCEISG